MRYNNQIGYPDKVIVVPGDIEVIIDLEIPQITIVWSTLKPRSLFTEGSLPIQRIQSSIKILNVLPAKYLGTH